MTSIFTKEVLLYVHPETNYLEPQTLNQKMTNHLLTKIPTMPTA